MTRPTQWTTIACALSVLAVPTTDFHDRTARAAPHASIQAPDVTARFLANEGVLLSDGSRAVLLDALVLPYKDFPVPSRTVQDALEQAGDPFDRVAVVLATHRHGDHFHPLPVARHLAANPRATFVGAPQVLDSLADRLAELRLPAARARAVAPRPGAWQTLSIDGITLHALGWPHGSSTHRDVQHVAWLVEIGGRRVLHAGDAELTSPELERLRLDTARIDLALLPSWMHASADARARVQRLIRPARVVLIHERTAVDPELGTAVETVSLGAARTAR